MRGSMIHWPGSTRNQSFESEKLTISLSIPPPSIFSSSSFRYFLSPKALFFFFFEIQGFEGKKNFVQFSPERSFFPAFNDRLLL